MSELVFATRLGPWIGGISKQKVSVKRTRPKVVLNTGEARTMCVKVKRATLRIFYERRRIRVCACAGIKRPLNRISQALPTIELGTHEKFRRCIRQADEERSRVVELCPR